MQFAHHNPIKLRLYEEVDVDDGPPHLVNTSQESDAEEDVLPKHTDFSGIGVQGKTDPRCKSFPAPDSWRTVLDCYSKSLHFEECFEVDGKCMATGKIITFEHKEIHSIIASVIHKCDGSMFSNSKYSEKMKHVSVHCRRSRTFMPRVRDDERMRGTNTDLYIPNTDSVRCPCCVNFYWKRVMVNTSAGPEKKHAWVVGKINGSHEGHSKPTQKVARLTPAQRVQYGAEMVNANLSAAQVMHQCEACGEKQLDAYQV